MIFITLFVVFLKIGIFTFGGGYAMIALIQNEVVCNHGWLSMTEFTDLLAISQMTPGPIGINTATYAGYSAVINAGYSYPLAILGAVIASGAVILLPVILIIIVLKFLDKYRSNVIVENVFQLLRLAIVGLIASAALILFTEDTFGVMGINRQFIISVFIFIGVFLLSLYKRLNPILLIVFSGIVGGVVYSF